MNNKRNLLDKIDAELGKIFSPLQLKSIKEKINILNDFPEIDIKNNFNDFFINILWKEFIGPVFYSRSILSIERQCEVLKVLTLVAKEKNFGIIKETSEKRQFWYNQKIKSIFLYDIEYCTRNLKILLTEEISIVSIKVKSYSEELNHLLQKLAEFEQIKTVALDIKISELQFSNLSSWRDSICSFDSKKLEIIFDCFSFDSFIAQFCSNTSFTPIEFESIINNIKVESQKYNKLSLLKEGSISFKIQTPLKPAFLNEIEGAVDVTDNYKKLVSIFDRLEFKYNIVIIPTAVGLKVNDPFIITPILFFKNKDWETIPISSNSNYNNSNRLFIPSSLWTVVNIFSHLFLNDNYETNGYKQFNFKLRKDGYTPLIESAVYELDKIHIHPANFIVLDFLENMDTSSKDIIGEMLYKLDWLLTENKEPPFNSFYLFENAYGIKQSPVIAIKNYYQKDRLNFEEKINQSIIISNISPSEIKKLCLQFEEEIKLNWLKTNLDDKFEGITKGNKEINELLNKEYKSNLIEFISNKTSFKDYDLEDILNISNSSEEHVIVLCKEKKKKNSILNIKFNVIFELQTKRIYSFNHNIYKSNFLSQRIKDIKDEKQPSLEELERKYIINVEKFKERIEEKQLLRRASLTHIEQAYLSISSNEEVRIRKSIEIGNKKPTYELTYKTIGDGISLKETIFLEVTEYNDLLNVCKGKIISKDRYKISSKELGYASFDETFEIDIFKEDLFGLMIAEIRFKDQDNNLNSSTDRANNFDKSHRRSISWLDTEVTYTRDFKNYNLAINGLPGVNKTSKTEYDKWNILFSFNKKSSLLKKIFKKIISDKKNVYGLSFKELTSKDLQIRNINSKVVKILMNSNLIVFDLSKMDLNLFLLLSIRLSSEKPIILAAISEIKNKKNNTILENLLQELTERKIDEKKYPELADENFFWGNEKSLIVNSYKVPFLDQIKSSFNIIQRKIQDKKNKEKSSTYDRFREFSEFTKKKMIVDDAGLSAIERESNEIWVVSTSLKNDVGENGNSAISKAVQENIRDGKKYYYFIPNPKDMEDEGDEIKKNYQKLLEILDDRVFNVPQKEGYSEMKHPLFFQFPQGLNYFFDEIIIYFRDGKVDFGFTYVEFEEDAKEPELLKIDKSLLFRIVNYLKQFVVKKPKLEKLSEGKIKLQFEFETPILSKNISLYRRTVQYEKIDEFIEIDDTSISIKDKSVEIIDNNPSLFKVEYRIKYKNYSNDILINEYFLGGIFDSESKKYRIL